MSHPENVNTAEGNEAIAQLTSTVEALFEAHERLQAQLDLLSASAPDIVARTAGSGGAGGAAPDWRHLDDDAAALALEDLLGWVGWLTDRFRLAADLPDCWARHTDLLEELSALRAAHAWAYGTKATPADALLWLEALDRARARWGHWNTTRCTRNQHRAMGRSTV